MFETSVKARYKTHCRIIRRRRDYQVFAASVLDPQHLFAARLMAKLSTKVFVNEFPVVVFRSAFRLLEWQNNTNRHVIHVTSESGAATLSVYINY